MKKFELDKDNFFEIENSIGLILRRVTNVSDALSMKILIDYFNKEYMWDSMFTINDVLDRLNRGDVLFILSYNHIDIGYVWFREIDKTNCYLYNLYVTRQLYRPKNAPIWFVNRVSKKMLNIYSKIVCECEDWHINAQNLFIKSGFKEI